MNIWVPELLPNAHFDPGLGGLDLEGDRYVPLFVIHETEASYEIEGDLPQTKRDEVVVRSHRNAIEIRCTHAIDHVDSTPPTFGAFQRRLALAHPIDVDGVETTMRHGVLVIRAPKLRS